MQRIVPIARLASSRQSGSDIVVATQFLSTLRKLRGRSEVDRAPSPRAIIYKYSLIIYFLFLPRFCKVDNTFLMTG